MRTRYKDRMAMNEIKMKRIVARRNEKMEFDPAGFFVIYLRKGEIVAEHYKNVVKDGRLVTGEVDVEIHGEDAEALCHTIIDEGLATLPDHCTYIGRELQRAETCLKMGWDYEQDGEDGY